MSGIQLTYVIPSTLTGYERIERGRQTASRLAKNVWFLQVETVGEYKKGKVCVDGRKYGESIGKILVERYQANTTVLLSIPDF